MPSPEPRNSTTESVAPERVPGRHPERIGRYHIKRVIASGGMTVYEAMQESPRRVVAVKVMKHGIASRSAMRRFEYEGQILGRLRHPGIAQIYEAGVHQDQEGVAGSAGGTVPFFAMEYIPNAKPITQFCEEKKLGSRQKMELFARVCDAVHHGHQKGIIHRDLKPSNILVDSTGQVKIIDFGVARSTDSDLAVTTLQTDVGQLIGTLQYMSPEQCEADPHDIDIRSDVYALGVVFYELLCGKVPYDVTRLAIHQATRLIREQHPTRLSTINRALRGDVETIALKALEKERERRYQSAADLASDIQRFLTGEGILARRASVIYQLRLFARRNKAVFASLAAVFVILVAGIIVSTSLYFRADHARQRAVLAEQEQSAERQRAELAERNQSRERQRAEQEALTAKRVSEFLVDLFRVSDPWGASDPSEAKGDTITAREILDRGAEKITRELTDQPVVRATVLDTIGTVYMGLGLNDSAKPLLESALTIRRQELGVEHRDIAETLHHLAELLNYLGEFAEAEPLLLEALAMRRKLLGDAHPDVAKSLNMLGDLRWFQGKYAEQESLCREALAIYRKSLGDENSGVAESLHNLGMALRGQDKLAEAESLLREALAMRRKLVGEVHPDVAYGLDALAIILRDQGKLDEAEPPEREALSMFRTLLGDEHPHTLSTLTNLGCLLRDRGKLAEAEPLLREALAGYRKLLGDEHPEVFTILTNLGRLLTYQGKLAEAEAILRESTEKRCAARGNERPECGHFRGNLGDCLTRMGRFDEAEKELLEAHRVLAGTPVQRWTLKAVQRLVALYDAWDAAEPGKGYAEKAAAWRRELDSPA